MMAVVVAGTPLLDSGDEEKGGKGYKFSSFLIQKVIPFTMATKHMISSKGISQIHYH